MIASGNGSNGDESPMTVGDNRTNTPAVVDESNAGIAPLHDEGGVILENSFISFSSFDEKDVEEARSDVSPLEYHHHHKEEEGEEAYMGVGDGDHDDIRSISSTRLSDSISSENDGGDGDNVDDHNSISLSLSNQTDATIDENMPAPNSNQYSPFAFTRGLACQYRSHTRSQLAQQRRQQQQRKGHLTTTTTTTTTMPPAPIRTTIGGGVGEGGGNNSSSSSSSSEPVVVLGVDISHLNSTSQFLVCAAGVFSFNLSFGFLQEFVAVEICNRNLGLFLAMMQFTGYTVLSYILRTFVANQRQQKQQQKQQRQTSHRRRHHQRDSSSSSSPPHHASDSVTSPSKGRHHSQDSNNHNQSGNSSKQQQIHSYPTVPTYLYLGLGGLSAIDMAMTNMAMHYINYPAKTLMKSSRVVFTMIFGVLLAGKRYRLVDYLIVLCMVGGLAIFLNADASSNAIFEPMGVFMLTISLICDGATNIMSETIMKNYGVGQDELIFRMYSLALMAVTATATFKGDLRVGFIWMTRPGTYDEWKDGASEDEITWNALGKITMIVLFSSMGFFGSSCSAAITKNFGALTMSMTSTARRATTLFISFFMFDNECTVNHVAGVVIFISAMTTKSLMASRSKKGPKNKVPTSPPPQPIKDAEAGRAIDSLSASSVAGERSQQQHLTARPTDLSRRMWSGK